MLPTVPWLRQSEETNGSNTKQPVDDARYYGMIHQYCINSILSYFTCTFSFEAVGNGASMTVAT